MAHRLGVIAMAAVAAFVVGGVAHASIPDANNAFHGCVNKAGRLRVIDPATTACKTGKQPETAIAWNQQGPPGPQGDPGPRLADIADLNGVHCTKRDLDGRIGPGEVVVTNTINGNGTSVGSGNPLAMSCEYSALVHVTGANGLGDVFVWDGPMVNGQPSSGHVWARCVAPPRNASDCSLRLPAGTYTIGAATLGGTWTGDASGGPFVEITLVDYQRATLTGS